MNPPVYNQIQGFLLKSPILWIPLYITKFKDFIKVSYFMNPPVYNQIQGFY